jgi:hypothetical protein
MDMKILCLWLGDDVDKLHVKIDNLNTPPVKFCFIKNKYFLKLNNLGLSQQRVGIVLV